MATFGSTAGQYNASRDFLAEALANAGQTAGQAIANTGQAFAQGVQHQQALKAQQEQKKLAMMQGELDGVEARAQRLAQTPGADPQQVDTFVTQEKQNVYRKYGMASGEQDNVAAALTMPQSQQQATPTSSTGGTVATDKPASTMQRPPLTAANIYAGARENQAKAESAKNDREYIEANRRTIRKDLKVTDQDLRTDPVYSAYDIGTREGSEAIMAEAARRQGAEDVINRIKIARQTGADAANRDVLKDKLDNIPEPSEATKTYSAQATGFNEGLSKLRQEIKAGDFASARATAQTMKGLVNSLAGQGAMGKEEQAGLLSAIDTFVATDPNNLRIGRDWEQLDRDLEKQSKVINAVRVQRFYDDGLSASGRVKLAIPKDGGGLRYEAVDPLSVREAIRKNPKAYVIQWASPAEAARY